MASCWVDPWARAGGSGLLAIAAACEDRAQVILASLLWVIFITRVRNGIDIGAAGKLIEAGGKLRGVCRPISIKLRAEPVKLAHALSVCAKLTLRARRS